MSQTQWQRSYLVAKQQQRSCTALCRGVGAGSPEGEDLESEQGWIEVILPTQRRQQEAKPIAAKLLFVGDTVREKFSNTMVSEIRALLRRKCNNEGYTKVAPQ
ncbi:unnamed protein product [Boreogadus saida]